MTVQQLCDELTALSHNGLAQAKVNIIDGYLVTEIEQVIVCDEENIELKGIEQEVPYV